MSTQSDYFEDPLSIRAPGTNLPGGHPSTGLLARAQRGWNTFLARTEPLPGEDEEIERGRCDNESAER
ncbi:hypothetical protein OH786_21910 [Streptomyces atratus]|uniref:Uncharacterized protein n=1 Tax=Streptomyces atratus TaxID=1893 RepID=A0A1K1WML3_STRAR|nr:hypothetical protein [Streptomyces atratus]SFX38616.1 hypothetical protein SAMN02787144_1002538 [Streptomyces atratus]